MGVGKMGSVGQGMGRGMDSEAVLTTLSSLLQFSRTVLMEASEQGHLDVVRLLLAQRANVNLLDRVS